MRILPAVCRYKCNSTPGFGAGKSFLYTDFDGTLLAQPLHDIYGSDDARKETSVSNFNKYFGEIQEYIEKTQNKFEIILTTGRRLFGDKQEGFEPTCQKMTQAGIRLPRIKSIITSEGGDIYHFRADGTIDRTPDASKANAIKQACGWDNNEIKSILDKISQETGIGYKFVDSRGSYKLSILPDDASKVDIFYSKLTSALEGRAQAKSKIDDVKAYLDDVSYSRVRGIKLEPVVNGEALHKDFDTKIALKRAIENNDFLLIAGDADNDKESLNIFRYVKPPEGLTCPQKLNEITAEYVQATRDEIEKLPLKILFIKPKSSNPDLRTFALHEFMRRQERLFPKKVKVVEQTQIGANNNFLDAIKSSISEYASENKLFALHF